MLATEHQLERAVAPTRAEKQRGRRDRRKYEKNKWINVNAGKLLNDVLSKLEIVRGCESRIIQAAVVASLE